jgi:hypothetical protein
MKTMAFGKKHEAAEITGAKKIHLKIPVLLENIL